MASSRDSTRRPASLTEDDVRRRVSRHLEDALDADQPSEKNYHIRSALQRLVVDDAPSD
jgi:hypothetical protein